MAEKYNYGPFKHGIKNDFRRADLEVYGIDHFRPSYVARIYFNDTKVQFRNATEDRPSYAGNFAIFGHGTCSGDTGHCDLHGHSRRFDNRRSHPLTRAFKRVIVTDALRRAVEDRDTLTITIIVAGPDDAPEIQGRKKPSHRTRTTHHYKRLFEIQGLQLTTFD